MALNGAPLEFDFAIEQVLVGGESAAQRRCDASLAFSAQVRLLYSTFDISCESCSQFDNSLPRTHIWRHVRACCLGAELREVEHAGEGR